MTTFVRNDNNAQINDWYIEAYKDYIAIKAMQLDSKLSDTVDQETFEGYETFVDRYDGTGNTLTQRTAKYAANTYAELGRDRRLVQPAYFEYTERFDPRDVVNTQRALRPDSSFSRVVMGLFNKKKDDIIVTAFDASVTDDRAGAVTFASDGGTTIDKVLVGASVGTDAGGNTGLSVHKVIEAYTTLVANDTPESEDWFAACHPNQVGQIMTSVDAASAYDARFTSSDFVAMKPLQTGQATFFMGFNWRTTTSIAQEAANAFTTPDTGRYAYFYSRPSMQFYMDGRGVEVHSDIIPDFGHKLQMAHYATMAALRIDGKQVVRAECVEA